MANSTSITYRLKRKILTFTNKISRRLSKPDRKFTADMVYGILASRSCLLTDISDQLHETVHKVNTVKRLSNHLSEGTPASAAASYLHTVKRLVPSEPVVLIDESDIENQMENSLKLLVSFAMVLKAHRRKVFIKKDTM